MKYRLDSAPWTDEDKAVMTFRLGHQMRHGYDFWDIWMVCLMIDRRDAHAMLNIESCRRYELFVKGRTHWPWAYAHSILRAYLLRGGQGGFP